MNAATSGGSSPRNAIVDIGSNSIRLVVFGGAARAPAVLFNEKIMAGLGRGLASGGCFDPEARALALDGLGRFAALVALMQPIEVRAVATAATRDAADGEQFLEAVRALGLPAELLDGDGEAVGAAHGVLSAHPGVSGLVADMGGGSLELARISDGDVHERVSLPLGAIRVAAIRAGGRGQLRKVLRKQIAGLDWLAQVKGQPLYLVGGAWRALARVHMHLADWPLPVLGDYAFSAADARQLKQQVRALGMAQLVAVPGVKPARAVQLDDAAALLAALVTEVSPAQVVISAFGLREGLLFERLDPATRALDPLIEGVRHVVAGQAPLPGQAEALLAWSDAAFPDEPAAERRLRHAACLIAGTSWASSPDFRVIDGEDMALHGSWIGISHADRAVMAMALHVGLGGDPAMPPALLARLAPPERLDRARGWGFALRLAQRLGGSAGARLDRLTLRRDGAGDLELRLPAKAAALVDAAARRRLDRLAQALGCRARVVAK